EAWGERGEVVGNHVGPVAEQRLIDVEDDGGPLDTAARMLGGRDAVVGDPVDVGLPATRAAVLLDRGLDGAEVRDLLGLRRTRAFRWPGTAGNGEDDEERDQATRVHARP